MKSGLLFLAALLMTTLSFAKSAEAKELMADACVNGGTPIQAASLSPNELRDLRLQAAFADVDVYASQELAFQMPKLTCQDLRSAKDAITMVSFALMPASTAIRMTSAGAEIAASIAALGISAPAVAGVTVLGSAGLAVFYIVLMQKEDECKKQDQAELKRQLFQELESKYGIRTLPNQRIQYQ